MDSIFEKMVKVNIQGRVFVTCQSRGISDPAVIGYYVEILEQAVTARLTDESSPSDFQHALDEQLKWLESELDQTRLDQPASTEKRHTDEEPAVTAPAAPASTEKPLPSGYVPEAKSMPERLRDRRTVLEGLLVNDCVTLKLVTPDEADRFKHGLMGKDPEKAEEEVVTALRNALHQQMRKFIRKHNGGPWASSAMQEEMRMDIARTRSLQSLVTLARELLAEREEWLDKSKGSITGRLFGGRVKLDK
jgi:hypothetical protein